MLLNYIGCVLLGLLWVGVRVRFDTIWGEGLEGTAFDRNIPSSGLLLQNLKTFIFKVGFRWKRVVFESDNKKVMLVGITVPL